MVEEAELENIRKKVFAKVNNSLEAAKRSGSYDSYSGPILSSLAVKQPVLWQYVASKAKAAEIYRSQIARVGYLSGAAVGYDLMTSYIQTLRTYTFGLRRISRSVLDVANHHITCHDPVYGLAGIISAQRGRDAGDLLLTREWFYRGWANDYSFGINGLSFKKASSESKEYLEQVNKTPRFLRFLSRLDLSIDANPGAKQGVMTGILDQVMIYRYRLDDIDGPDQRYILLEDGSKQMIASPTDKIFIQRYKGAFGIKA